MSNEQNEFRDQKSGGETDIENTQNGTDNSEYYLTSAVVDDHTKPDTLSIYLKSKASGIRPLRWSKEDEFYPIHIESIPERISGIERVAGLDKNYLNYKY